MNMPAIPPKMYRHFAVVTVLLTACIAMFADGENRQAVADYHAQQQRQTELRRRSAEMTRTPTIELRDPHQNTGEMDYGSAAENSDAYGRPMDDLGGRVHYAPGARNERPPIAGYSQTYLNSLSDEEYERLLRSMMQDPTMNREERERNRRRLDSMSASRSGGGTNDDE